MTIYLTYDEMTEDQRRGVVGTAIAYAVVQELGRAKRNLVEWHDIKAVEKPITKSAPFTVVEKRAEKGETYFDPGTCRWVRRDDRQPTDFTTLVKVGHVKGTVVRGYDLTDDDLGRRVATTSWWAGHSVTGTLVKANVVRAGLSGYGVNESWIGLDRYVEFLD